MATKSIRITPAGAGKTNEMKRNIYKDGDHPRRCGENQTAGSVSRGSPGSPPQVRGKRGKRLRLSASWRITPAGAGKTCCSSSSQTPLQDHPRRCGENGNYWSVIMYSSGSPPQVRGKPKAPQATSDAVGITPAGAGKTEPRGRNRESI